MKRTSGMFAALALAALASGCAYQRYDTCQKLELVPGEYTIRGGALVHQEVKDNLGSTDKQTPFDFMRGLGKGAAVAAAPGAAANQSGTQQSDGADSGDPDTDDAEQ